MQVDETPTLFVGGCLDGKRLIMGDLMRTYTLPFSAERLRPLSLTEQEGAVAVQGSVEAWHRMRIYTGAADLKVMAYQGLSSAEVVGMLLSNYHVPEKKFTIARAVDPPA